MRAYLNLVVFEVSQAAGVAYQVVETEAMFVPHLLRDQKEAHFPGLVLMSFIPFGSLFHLDLRLRCRCRCRCLFLHPWGPRYPVSRSVEGRHLGDLEISPPRRNHFSVWVSSSSGGKSSDSQYWRGEPNHS